MYIVYIYVYDGGARRQKGSSTEHPTLSADCACNRNWWAVAFRRYVRSRAPCKCTLLYYILLGIYYVIYPKSLFSSFFRSRGFFFFTYTHCIHIHCIHCIAYIPIQVFIYIIYSNIIPRAPRRFARYSPADIGFFFTGVRCINKILLLYRRLERNRTAAEYECWKSAAIDDYHNIHCSRRGWLYYNTQHT